MAVQICNSLRVLHVLEACLLESRKSFIVNEIVDRSLNRVSVFILLWLTDFGDYQRLMSSILKRAHATAEVRLSEVLAGLSFALDLTEGQRSGHSVRTCAIGMRLAEALGLSSEQRSGVRRDQQR